MSWTLKVGLVLLAVVLLAGGWYGGVAWSADDLCVRSGWDGAVVGTHVMGGWQLDRFCTRAVEGGGSQACRVEYLLYNGCDFGDSSATQFGGR